MSGGEPRHLGIFLRSFQKISLAFPVGLCFHSPKPAHRGAPRAGVYGNRETESPRGRREAARQGLKAQGESYVRRLTILLATLGALLLVPAVASAAVDSHIVIEGSGSGTVVGQGELQGNPPINCTYVSPGPQTGVCDTEHGESEGFPGLLVKEEAAPGSVFAGWTLEGEEAFPVSCEEPLFETCGFFLFGGEATVKAVFEPAFPLTVEKAGEGTVVSSPGGINCGATCSNEFKVGSTVTLTASPASGYAFSKWKGCTVATGLKCEVTMSAAKTVLATFVPTNTLTVEKAGSGYGTAKATGISCDESCSTASSAIQSGKVVKVTTAPAKGSEAAVLEGGTGSASGCSGTTCEFTIEANSSVKVKFVPKPTSTLTLNLTGPGAYKGKVTGKSLLVKGLLKSAFNCGVGCTSTKESFFASDEVELTATAPTGYSFGGWTVSGGSAGPCTGKTTPCKLLSDANKFISAKFE